MGTKTLLAMAILALIGFYPHISASSASDGTIQYIDNLGGVFPSTPVPLEYLLVKSLTLNTLDKDKVQITIGPDQAWEGRVIIDVIPKAIQFSVWQDTYNQPRAVVFIGKSRPLLFEGTRTFILASGNRIMQPFLWDETKIYVSVKLVAAISASKPYASLGTDIDGAPYPMLFPEDEWRLVKDLMRAVEERRPIRFYGTLSLSYPYYDSLEDLYDRGIEWRLDVDEVWVK